MKRSRYVVKTDSYDGQAHIYYNLRNGLGLKVKKEWAPSFTELAEIPALQKTLHQYGFVQQEGEEEAVLEQYTSARARDPLHLVIMPHQNCNFRCVYCYEAFDKNKMDPQVEAALVKMAEERLKSGTHKVFSVSWFGGEPLLAPDVIERLSVQFREIADRYGVTYVAGITTNGYLLDDDTIDMLLRNKVTSFQISVDGLPEHHDKQRVRVGGQPTYDKIIENLQKLGRRSEEFRAIVRMNVGPENLPTAEDHILQIKKLLGTDPRYWLYFHNIGKWGGPNDEQMDVCSENVMVKLTSMAMDHGMGTTKADIWMGTNSVCYAASPSSFVIGVDGMLYKCTIALYDERNHVGQLNPDGSLSLHNERMALWTDGGSNDSTCRSCFYSPVCQGDSCPLIRLDQNRRPCPSLKTQVRDVVTLMDRQGKRFVEIMPETESTPC
ncbi:MAG TPA: radical SAM protein [Bacilli bacterium]|nr:radical SAM protein [Bacilli bacterium]